MSAFGLVFPSVTLARLTDPLELAAPAQKAGSTPTADVVRELAIKRLRRELRPILKGARQDGPVDEDWYWAAPIALERHLDPTVLADFFARRPSEMERVWASGGDGSDGDDLAGFGVHLARARDAANGWLPEGRPPDDLS